MKVSVALLFCIALLFALGLLMVFDTTAAEVLNRFLDKSTHHALIRQSLYALLGGIGAWLVWVLGYERLLQYSGVFLALGTVCLVLVFVPGIGQQINGAHRWLGYQGLSFQPSEFVKYLIPAYYIHAMTAREKPLLKDFLKLISLLVIPLALILIEPDNGTVAIVVAAMGILFFLTRLKWVYWVLPSVILLTAGVAVASRMAHVPDRIRIYLHPELDLRGKGHQPHQAKIAAGSGQLLGKGVGQSLQKLDYLPEARSDYIAAIYAEEFGFLGMVLLIGTYMTIGFLGFQIASKAPTLPSFYLVAAFTFLICFQAFLNLGVVSGLLPSKGTNLPFVSQGGSSLIANFMVMSVIFNVSRASKESNAA